MMKIVYYIRTLWVIAKYQYILRRATFGTGVKILGRLDIVGPGKVIIGDNCVFLPDAWGCDYVTLYSHSPKARIVLGNNVVIRGTRMGCFLSIIVEDNVILENASLYDSDFHNIDATIRDEKFHHLDRLVKVGEGSYIGCEALCSKGSVLGENVILHPGSVIGVKRIRDKAMALGNPARLL